MIRRMYNEEHSDIVAQRVYDKISEATRGVSRVSGKKLTREELMEIQNKKENKISFEQFQKVLTTPQNWHRLYLIFS